MAVVIGGRSGNYCMVPFPFKALIRLVWNSAPTTLYACWMGKKKKYGSGKSSYAAFK